VCCRCRKILRRVAVIGPTADDTMALLGNYYGTPTAPTTILQGIRTALPQADVRYARGADLVEQRNDPAAAALIETRYLRPSAQSGEHGLKGEYFRGRDCIGEPALTRFDAQVGVPLGSRRADRRSRRARRSAARPRARRRPFLHPLDRPAAAAAVRALRAQCRCE
jgi:hypothetical protein